MCWAVREWDISALPTGCCCPVYALSVTGLSAAVAQTVSRAAALEHWAEVRRIRDTARLACGVLGLFLSLCMFLLAEPSPPWLRRSLCLFSLLAIAPAALFGCLTAVERGYWEGLQNMTPTAVSQALEAVAKLGWDWRCASGCWRIREIVCRRVPADVPLSALAAAGAVLGVTLSTAVGWLYFLLRGLRSGNRLPRGNAPAAPMGQDLPAAALCDDSGGAGVSGDESHLAAGSGDHDALSGQGADAAQWGTAPAVRDSCICTGFSGLFVYGSFTGMAITVFNLVPSVTNMLGKRRTALCGGALGKTGPEGVAAHIRSVTGAAGGQWRSRRQAACGRWQNR